MPTWTFTTTDPTEALRLSTFCIALPFTTEREIPDAPDKDAPAKPRRKAAPADQGCWRDTEARKLRTKVQGWAATNTRRKGEPFSYNSGRYDADTKAYADALGVTPEQAAEKIEYHRACEAEFTRTGGRSARP